MSLKKISLYICICLCVFLTACAKKEPQIYYGDYADAKTTQDISYIKSYLIMDCCDEWPEFVDFAKTIKGAGGIEGFEIYFYDEDANEISPKRSFTVYFHPTNSFKELEGEVTICEFPTGVLHTCEITENGDIMFETQSDGIYMAVKYADIKYLWISNEEDCTGQCRTCSDDW